MKKKIDANAKNAAEESRRLDLANKKDLKNRFRVRSRALGANKDLNYDKISEFTEKIEGVEK